MNKLNNKKLDTNFDANINKDMAELYFKLYSGCLKYKKEKDKNIDCDVYYNSFLFHTKKYNEDNL